MGRRTAQKLKLGKLMAAGVAVDAAATDAAGEFAAGDATSGADCTCAEAE